jgi:hypothetical protein
MIRIRNITNVLTCTRGLIEILRIDVDIMHLKGGYVRGYFAQEQNLITFLRL